MEVDHGYSPIREPTSTDQALLDPPDLPKADKYKKTVTSTADEKFLGELESEAEKLLALLKDRQGGLAGWHILAVRRIRSLHALTGRLDGK